MICVLTMLLTSCDVLTGIIGGEEPDSENTPAVCADNDGDHICDECKEKLTKCEDANNDHKCELCGAVLGECVDSNKDHKCDECTKVLSECTDTDKNHACDICGGVTSECVDSDKDHECDECTKVISVCREGDGHKCIDCGATMSVCADNNSDHKCDGCEKSLSDCYEGTVTDHRCELCDTVISECYDGNGDHECDVCKGATSSCTDENRDHFCELCSERLSECSDATSDHKCDVCATALSECNDENNDHYCDICKIKLTNCADNDSNHKCDACEQTLSVCLDNDNDHECDVCSLTLSYCKDTSPIDHKCDICATTLSECTYESRVCTVCGDTTLYKHVVIVGVDGAGGFFKDTDTPNMDAIFADGAITYTGITESPSISAECWASLLHGVNASVHGVTASSPTAFPQDSPFPSFLRVIRENDPSAVLGSYTTWNTINNLIVEDGIGVTKVGWSGTDADLTEKICTYVKSSAPTTLFIQFDNVDAAGHSFGFGSKEHLDKITETDALIGRIYDSYAEKGILDDTLFVVTTDHGGTLVPSGSYLGNHGGETPEEKHITFAAKGKTVVKGGTIEGFEIRDTAAIVLYALGYEQPETWTARVPSGLFEGVTAGERPTWSAPDVNATPKPDDDGYVTNYITDKELITYLTFDETCEDVCGTSTTVNKTITYQEGYFGKAASLNAGYITLDDFAMGADSFTVTMWVKTNGIKGDPVLLGNKDWKDSGTNPGIIIALHDPVAGYKENEYFIANLADGTNRIDLRPDLPLDFKDGFFHVTVIFDREASKLHVAFNFTVVATMDIPDTLKNATAESLMPMNLGQDGTGAYTSALNATVDEFMIFGGAFTGDNLTALKEYYGQRVEEAPDVSESVSKDLIAHLTFDGNITDSTGNYETVANKSTSYGEGYSGNAMALNGSSVTVKDLELGTNSVTFSAWVKVTGMNGNDPVLFANKDWNSGNNPGLLVCLHANGTLIVNFSDGTAANRVDLKPTYPTDMLNRWMHILVVIDREAGEMRVSFDFGDFVSISLQEKNASTSLDGAYDFVIGQDGTTTYKDGGNVYLKGYIDDFMIFDGAFNENDLDELKEYYNK